MRGKVLAVLVSAALFCGACSAASPTSSSGSGSGGTPGGLAGNRVPLPAGRYPSAISKMVCSKHLQKELAEVLGVTPVTVTTPTWENDVYSCTYRYSNGSFMLSVKELSSWPQTYAYFSGLGKQLGNTGKINGLGQGAFSTTNGSVTVRKDWKVLLVDVSGLPAHFGVPPTTSADVAVSIADLILGCWSGD